MRTLTVAAILSLALPAQAHTEAELEAWLDQWEATGEMDWPLATADLPLFDLDAHQANALADMVERHPCSRVLDTWSEACEPPVARPRLSPQAPAGTHRGMGSNVEQWRGLVAAYFGSETDYALRIMACESGGNANAYNPSSASGLFQVKQFWFDAYGGNAFDPENNVRVAKLVRDSQSWSAWTCSKKI